MGNIITTYGGGELFILVFNGIAALFRTDATGMIVPLIRVGLMVGLVYVAVLMLFRNQLIEGLRWFLWVVIATHLLFLPKTRVHIHDPLNAIHRDIDNVPWALGMFAGFVSQCGKVVTERFESVFTLPDYMPYHQTGTVFASSLMSQVGQFRIVDPVFKGNMERFVNQCVVYDAMIGHKYTLTDLQNSNDLWAFVRTRASPVLGFLYKEGQDPGTVVTCRAGADRLNALWNAEIQKATLLYGNRVHNRILTARVFNTSLMGSARLLAGAAGWADSAQAILQQEMMINAIEEGSNNKLSELGSASNYAATKALLQQRSAYAIAGDIAARTLPLFKNVIEAFSYALFIFIVVLALLPNGYRALLTYGGILVWVQLWAPLYAVLNLVMTLYGQIETRGLGAQLGLTLLNSSAVINANTDMVTLAAWLSVSIPFISYGILKQGAGAFVGLAQHLGSAMQSAASSAASETVSGNISLGNVSIGTQAYQNTSAFQHNTSPSYNASQFKSLSTSGVEQSTFGDGSQALNDQAMSRLKVQIMGTENTSFAQQESLNNAMSVVQSKSLASSEATESAIQQSTNFLSRVGSDQYTGEDFNKSVTSSEAQTLQKFKNYVNDIRQSTGLNEAQATEAAVAANVGGSLGTFVGVGLNGRFASSGARQQAIESAKSIAQQTNYSESADKVVSAAQHFSEGHRDTKGAELGHGASASLNHSKSLREDLSIAQNQVETLSKDISRSQSKGLSINKDLTQDVLEFITHQPTNPGPDGASGGQIGYEGARKILENGGEERAPYLQRFQEQNPQYSIQGINTGQGAGATQGSLSSEDPSFTHQQQNLQQHFEGLENNLKQKADIRTLEDQDSHNTQAIQQKGKDQGLDFEKDLTQGHRQETTPGPSQSSSEGSTQSSPQSSKEDHVQDFGKGSSQISSSQIVTEVRGLHQGADQKIAEGRGIISAHEDSLHQSKTDSDNKNMTGAVFKNAYHNVFEDILPASLTSGDQGSHNTQVVHRSGEEQNLNSSQGFTHGPVQGFIKDATQFQTQAAVSAQAPELSPTPMEKTPQAPAQVITQSFSHGHSQGHSPTFSEGMTRNSLQDSSQTPHDQMVKEERPLEIGQRVTESHEVLLNQGLSSSQTNLASGNKTRTKNIPTPVHKNTPQRSREDNIEVNPILGTHQSHSPCFYKK